MPITKSKTVYNKATGEHQKPAKKMDTTEWWKGKLFGLSPASLRNRKKKVDKEVNK